MLKSVKGAILILQEFKLFNNKIELLNNTLYKLNK
jgi:hypothetical protein